jgi:hypothetical protein
MGRSTQEEGHAVTRTKVRDVEQSLFPDLVPDKPIGYILPSVFVGTNADLMAAVAPYYLTGSVLDVTYGEGKWWDKYRPAPFTYHDLHKVDGVDFTDLPEADGSVDTVCFDPPYVLSGGLGATDMHDRFGIGIANLGHSSAKSFEPLIRDGLRECARVCRRFLLVKCMEFAQGCGSDGGFKDIPYLVRRWADDLSLRRYDVIVHHTGSGPGGHNIFDPKRARRHHSYLLVFAKGKA